MPGYGMSYGKTSGMKKKTAKKKPMRKPAGRKNVPGKPIQYGTTDNFLSHFNLTKLSDLPNVEELTSAGLIDPSPHANADKKRP